MIEAASLSSYTVDEKQQHSTKWMDTQECHRSHKVGYIARYYLSTAPVEITAQTETANAAVTTTMTMTSSEMYWMTVKN
jgi:Tfp pilus assembly major pilin PilA